MIIYLIDGHLYDAERSIRMQIEEITGICKALGEENRLKMVQMLTNGEKCACELLDAFDITQPTLSHHMKVLCDCGLVKCRKEGKWNHYSIDCERFRAFKGYINEIVCGSATDAEDGGCCR